MTTTNTQAPAATEASLEEVSALRWLLNITTEFDRKDVRTRQAARLLDDYSNGGKTNREHLESLWSKLATPAPAVGASLTDEQIGRVAYKGYDDYWTEDCAGRESEAWIASAKAVLAHAVSASVQPVPVAYSEGRTLHWHAGRGITDAQLYAGPVQPVQASLSDDVQLAAIIRGMVALTEIGWAPDLRFDDDGHWKVQADTFDEHPWHDTPLAAWDYFVRVRLDGHDDALAALASSTPTKGGA